MVKNVCFTALKNSVSTVSQNGSPSGVMLNNLCLTKLKKSINKKSIPHIAQKPNILQ